MQRVALKRSKKANALTDPKPNFVSLVKAGANMTPFKSVVRYDGLSEEDAMHINTAKADDHEIAMIAFKGDAFAKRSAVMAWLEEGGYENCEITEKDDHFAVVGRTDLEDTREIDAGNGVTVTVGKLPVETAKEEEAPENKANSTSAVVAAKSEDEAGNEGTSEESGDGENASAPVAEETAEQEEAQQSSEETVDGGAQAGEGSEIVEQKSAQELYDEAVAKLGAAGIEVGTRKSMYATHEIGSVLSTLVWLKEDAEWVGLSDGDVTAIKAAAGQLLSVLVSSMNDTVDNFVEAFRGTTEKSEEAPAEEEAPATKSEEEQEGSASSTTEEEPVAKSEDEGKGEIAELKEQVAALSAKLEEMSKPVEKQEATQGVEPVERQTRKGADVGEVPEGSTAKKDDGIDDLRRRSMLGISTTALRKN